jgi:hypothetical protein
VATTLLAMSIRLAEAIRLPSIFVPLLWATTAAMRITTVTSAPSEPHKTNRPRFRAATTPSTRG